MTGGESLTPSRDARGFVVEPLSLAQLTAQKNCHVVWTVVGGVRGNHHHVRGTEVTLVLGPALVRFRDGGGIRDVRIPQGSVYRFTFPPIVAHAYGAIGPEPMLLVGFNTEIHNPQHPDAVADPVLGTEELATLAAKVPES